ncbi:helix-turn-helix domain-containing protein [Caldifermentibacillus hisashii]|jgi:transcriptional regulator with XRE-family HTH domain|uniref:helix-turn-helix domain-containing protein n=1 Tax=Caldifermentibacillus hisashii TaxID=996558 RepID=UPI001C11C08B|nr:helix-turn-helix transcriptional regulator [Caldifermentibacillus hisashii]MBU5343842.1 helix-turn-helix domain-containing protein [Caldifermentibacillus hisashii]
MSDFLKLVGDKVKFHRKEQGLTQEQLADKSDLQYSYIGGVERGERIISLLTLEKIINSLDISPESFFSFKEIDTLDKNNVNQVISIHKSLLQTRNIEEIKLIHNITKDILTLIDSQK